MRRRHALPLMVVLLQGMAAVPCTAQAQQEDSPLYGAWMDLRDSDGHPTATTDEDGTDDLEQRLEEKESDALPGAPEETSRMPGPRFRTHAETIGPGVEHRRASRLEVLYSERAGEPLRQFGYDLLGTGQTKRDPRSGIPGGAAQDDFLISAGDSLRITFRGQTNSTDIYKVGEDGQILIRDLQPVAAAGLRFGELREAIRAETQTLPNTDVFIGLDAIRQIDVIVAGHVGAPGRQTLTAFDTVIDALAAAGGIDPAGSLRAIRLTRAGRTRLIDLYSLLNDGGADTDLSLKDGDRLIVPPVGPTVAVAGNVKRPGIYELRAHLGSGQAGLTLIEMLDFGGGLLTPGHSRNLRLSLDAQGNENVTTVADRTHALFTDGSILMVSAAQEKRRGMVELAGHTREPGVHALAETPTLSALLSSDRVLGPDIYPLLGIIDREDKTSLSRRLVAFSPLPAAQGRDDRTLMEGDVVHLFSTRQIRDLQSGRRSDANDALTDPVLSAFLKERMAYIRGAVRREGGWPVGDDTDLGSLLSVAGGTTLEADVGNVEVTSALSGQGMQAYGAAGTRRTRIDLGQDDPTLVRIAPGDTVRVNRQYRKLEENSVQVLGQVQSPGRYDLLPGDRLSDLLARAGGLTLEAYPQGAIFSRQSERLAEEQRFREEARALEVSLAAAVQDKDGKTPNGQQISSAQGLIAQLREAKGVGRLTVEADPAALALDPAVDILLEKGDRIFIPQRPMTVRLRGEVLSPANLQFRQDKDAVTYIREAGGYTYNADKGRAFVLYPDGSAQPLHVGAWNHSAAMIPPGSTIVVPRDPKPFDFLETARDVTQILSNLAVTGIFINDIADD